MSASTAAANSRMVMAKQLICPPNTYDCLFPAMSKIDDPELGILTHATVLIAAPEAWKPSSRLGLIDFGQCKHLTSQEQAKVARLILAVANGESDGAIVTAFRAMGVEMKNDSTEFLASFAKLMFGRFEPHHMDHSWH